MQGGRASGAVREANIKQRTFVRSLGKATKPLCSDLWVPPKGQEPHEILPKTIGDANHRL